MTSWQHDRRNERGDLSPDHAEVERQTIEAALHGSRAAALRALAHHPLVDSVRVARALLEDARSTFPHLSYLT